MMDGRGGYCLVSQFENIDSIESGFSDGGKAAFAGIAVIVNASPTCPGTAVAPRVPGGAA